MIRDRRYRFWSSPTLKRGIKAKWAAISNSSDTGGRCRDGSESASESESVQAPRYRGVDESREPEGKDKPHPTRGVWLAPANASTWSSVDVSAGAEMRLHYTAVGTYRLASEMGPETVGDVGETCGRDGARLWTRRGEDGGEWQMAWGQSDVVRAGWNLAPRSGKGWSVWQSIPCRRLLHLRLLLRGGLPSGFRAVVGRGPPAQ